MEAWYKKFLTERSDGVDKVRCQRKDRYVIYNCSDNGAHEIYSILENLTELGWERELVYMKTATGIRLNQEFMKLPDVAKTQNLTPKGKSYVLCRS